MNRRLMKHGRTLGLVAALITPFASAWSALLGCGDLNNAYGPFDVRKAARQDMAVVELHHFTPKVENLISGQEGYLGSDIDYTLRAMPNNPRALNAMMRLGEREKTEKVSAARYSVECYFDRALRFAPDDPDVHLLYAIYLKNHKRLPEMRAQIEQAEHLQGDTPTSWNLDYNAGLMYFETKEYDKSAAAAQRAYAMGAPFPALRDKLKSVGKWKDN